MSQTAEPTRTPLSRERVMRAGITLASADGGLDNVSMRRVGQELGVEAMSLYNHVANKAALVDGMVDLVIDELNARVQASTSGGAGPDWRSALRRRILLARELMLEHRWVPAALESRTSVSPGLILYFDGVLGIMIAGGFSFDLAHHALHALGSRALGFSQELFNPATPADEAATEAELAAMAALAPHLVAMLADVAHDDPDSTLGWCDDQAEFEFGVDVLLEGLSRRLG
jgi:AcrR family transcriptional regulator